MNAAAQANAGSAVRSLRRDARLSQLELSLRVGVSQRHLSCIETGRARPSRAMLIALLDAMKAPLPQRNAALLAAGYAPQYAAHPLDHPAMELVRQTLGHLLQAHEPAPAMVLDAGWNLVQANRGGLALWGWLGGDPAAAQGVNMLRAMFVPGGLRERLIDGEEVLREVWLRALHDATHDATLRGVLAELAPWAPAMEAPATAQRPTPVLTTRLRTPHGVLAFFSTFTTFGAPLEITAASLRVEHLFPADAATRAVLERELG
jgi:transcriptional regulator with XRE-family HTH domain